MKLIAAALQQNQSNISFFSLRMRRMIVWWFVAGLAAQPLIKRNEISFIEGWLLKERNEKELWNSFEWSERSKGQLRLHQLLHSFPPFLCWTKKREKRIEEIASALPCCSINQSKILNWFIGGRCGKEKQTISSLLSIISFKEMIEERDWFLFL